MKIEHIEKTTSLRYPITEEHSASTAGSFRKRPTGWVRRPSRLVERVRSVRRFPRGRASLQIELASNRMLLVNIHEIAIHY